MFCVRLQTKVLKHLLGWQQGRQRVLPAHAASSLLLRQAQVPQLRLPSALVGLQAEVCIASSAACQYSHVSLRMLQAMLSWCTDA